MSTVLWLAAIALIVLGAAGTILPALPGPILVFAGIALAAWIDGFARIGPWLLVLLGALTLITWVIDYLAAAAGAKRVGASRHAIVGAFVGALVGVVTGLWGLLLMPFVGAAIGEYLAQRDLRRAAKVGAAAWLGLVIGTAAKVAIVAAMIGIFVFALVIA